MADEIAVAATLTPSVASSPDPAPVAAPTGQPPSPAPAATAPPAPAIDLKGLKLPEGFTAEDKNLADVVGILSDEKLSPQERMQKLVDTHASALKTASEASSKYWSDLQASWMTENKNKFGADPGKHADIVAVAKAIDQLGEKRAGAFREALDMSGMGNNPAIIEALVEWAKVLNEPSRHPSGSPAGRPASAAEAIYGKGP